MGAVQTQSAELIIDRYMVHDRIAAGGMAVVHLGRLLGQAGFSRTVAIKRHIVHNMSELADIVVVFASYTI